MLGGDITHGGVVCGGTYSISGSSGGVGATADEVVPPPTGCGGATSGPVEERVRHSIGRGGGGTPSPGFHSLAFPRCPLSFTFHLRFLQQAG